ncbi:MULTISPECIES: glycosyltransferase [unclassified Luteococcus]|uniref:glycosyltransferase n=1 Tax=unclassified Luteococcus TaxID=2639923 RepID=UPI00313CBB69
MARIGFISLHTSPLDSPGSKDAGGMNVVEVHQARALAERGHQVELVTRRDNPELPDVVEIQPGVTVRQLTAGPTEPLAKSAQEEWIGDFSDALARLQPYDVVHSQHWMSGVAALPVAKQWGVPHVQSFHSVAALPGDPLSEGEPPESPGRNAGERLIATESDLVIAVSRYEARTIIERCGADPSRVVVVHPGVDVGLFHPLDGHCRQWHPELNNPDEPPQFGPVCVQANPNGYLLFAARLQPLKAPDLALVAVAGIPEEIRPTLVIAGEASQDFADYRDELIDLSQDLGIAHQTCWLGSQSREDLARLVRGARAVLVPSFSETFGLIALEAQACGVAVVSADSGGLREAVADGETGVLVPERSAQAWTSVLTELLRDPERLCALGRAGRERALRFGWDAVAQQLEEHYAGLGVAAPAPGDQDMVTNQPRHRGVLAGVRRVLFCHAHPDDETLSTGALIVHLTGRGIACDLVTATRGEMGEVVPGPLSELAGTPELEAHRVEELAGALRELGVEQHAWLGTAPARAEGLPTRVYRDSGMEWIRPGLAGPADASDERSFTFAAAGEAAEDLLAVIDVWRPDLVVSYDANGGYGHPDHVRMHQVAAEAAARAGVRFAEVRQERPATNPATDSGSGEETGSETGGVVEWFDLPETLPVVAAALRHHASQLTVQANGTEVVHSGGQREAIVTAVGLAGN